MEIFGFEIKKRLDKNRQDPAETKQLKSFAPPYEDEGVSNIAAGGYYGQYYDIDGTSVESDKELILKYRHAAEQPECDSAIDDIVDEAIVSAEIGASVKLNLDDLNYTDDVKRKIQNEFDHIIKLLKFNEYGTDFFRRWYIDGKIYFHILVDSDNPKEGIQELRYVDPIHMRKVREISKDTDKLTGAVINEVEQEYFIYSPEPYSSTSNQGSQTSSYSSTTMDAGLKVSPDAMVYVTSGIMDASRKKVLSHLHKSIKLVNQLRMMEDALVVYRVARAPERRIFYIDVGNLPKGKAEEYVRNMMSQYRNKIVYDASTGAVRDDRRHQSMMEDFWLPRREGGRGTEITTLPGGQNLGEIEDILFFQKKLYKSLNIPIGRLESDAGFQFGRATEVSREEVKFQKFVNRLRQRFSYVMLDALKTQLILKGIIADEDWNEMSEELSIDYIKDNYFSELKEFEILNERTSVAGNLEALVEAGYYSKEWIRKNILKQTDEEIEQIDKQRADEKKEEEGALDAEAGDIEGGEEPPAEEPAADTGDELTV